MRLPRPSLDWLDGIGTPRLALYALFFLIMFVYFLAMNFPHHVIVNRALQEMNRGPIVTGVRWVSFGWLTGYELGGVTVRQRAWGPDEPPLVESASLRVRPGFDGLVRGRLWPLLVHADLYGGEVDGSLSMTDGMTRATVELDGVQLGRYPYLRELLEEGSLSGQLSGAASMEGRGTLDDARAVGEFDIADAGMTGAKFNGLNVPDLDFKQISFKFARQGTRLEIQEFRADGDQIKASGDGQIVLREPLGDSVLNMRLTVMPGNGASDDIKTLLSLIPRPKNARLDAPLTISGTLRQPRLR
jgi:type II secretion system protein N